MKPRSWAQKMVDWAQMAFGLQRWDVSTILETGMDRVADSHLQPEYEVALIRFDANTKNNKQGQIAALHEVVHLQHSPLYISWEYVLALVPEEHRDMARKMLNEADELVVQRWAAAWQERHELEERHQAMIDGLNAAIKNIGTPTDI
jgi:hypothetical protein